MANFTLEKCLEDINENVPGYGNHNYVYTVGYRQLQYTNLLRTCELHDHFNRNFKFHL